MERLPLIYSPGPEMTVGERLVPFRGRCSVKVCSPSKPGKYGIKIWAAYAAKSRYTPVLEMPKKKTGHACCATHDIWSPKGLHMVC